MIRRPPRSTRTDTPFPYTTLFRSKYVAQFRNRVSDWEAFEDAKVEGFKRAQHRFIGAGGSGKVGDDSVIPARGFTLSIMFVNPGHGNAAHTHEVEEVFFVLQGFLDVFLQDDSRPEERRVGQTCINTFGSRWSPYN